MVNWRELTEWYADTVGETIKQRDKWSQEHLPQVRTKLGIGYMDRIKVWDGEVNWHIHSLGLFTTGSGWAGRFNPAACEIVFDPTTRESIPEQLALF